VRLAEHLRLRNKQSPLRNKHPRPLNALLRLLVGLKLVALLLLLGKPKRLRHVRRKLLVKPVRLLLRRLRLNACKQRI
jgi:hypothetical protein